MRPLDFDSRSLIAKECINRVCELAKVKPVRKRKINKKIRDFIARDACLDYSGASVVLVSSFDHSSLKLFH